MPYGARREWTKVISGRQARGLQAAAAFAGEINRSLLYRAHINWNRTALGDDIDGSANAAFRQRLARWLRDPEQDGGPLHAIYVRERPTTPAAKPNDHFHLHVPAHLFTRLVAVAPYLLPPGAQALDRRAIVVDDEIGWTDRAREGALVYLLKGIAPGAAKHVSFGTGIEIEPESQGRVYGKRCGVSETLGPAARLRHRLARAGSNALSARRA